MTAVSPSSPWSIQPCARMRSPGLPPLEPFDFLRFDRRPAAIVDFGFLAEQRRSSRRAGGRPSLVAASVYAASSLARVVVMDGLFVLGLAAAIAVLNTFG